MKKTGTIITLVAIVVLFGGAMYWLWAKNAEDPVVYTSEAPSQQNIVKKTVATGSIVPKEEVLINPIFLESSMRFLWKQGIRYKREILLQR